MTPMHFQSEKEGGGGHLDLTVWGARVTRS